MKILGHLLTRVIYNIVEFFGIVRDDQEMKTLELLEYLEKLATIIGIPGLVIGIIFNSKSVRATRIESELNSFNTMSQRYNEIVEILMSSKKYQTTDWDELGDMKFKIYSLFDIFSVVHATKKYQNEVGKTFWSHWDKRITFLASKPAIQLAWSKHQKDQPHLYSTTFIQLMDSKISLSQKQN